MWALSWLRPQSPRRWTYTTFDVDLAHRGIPATIPDHDLLLADDGDPRAVAQAAHSALTDLRLWWPAPTLPGRHHDDTRRALRARAAHPEIRRLLDALHTVPDHELDDAILTTAARLQPLTEQR